MITGKPLREIAMFLGITVALCLIFFGVDFLDRTTGIYYQYTWPYFTKVPYTTNITWAPVASIFVACLTGVYIFYVLIPYIVYHHAKSQGRSEVRWVTAFVIFTPLLAGIAYLLTWPKGEEENK